MRILIISIVFLLLAAGLNYQVIHVGKTYRAEKAAYAEALNYRNRLLDPDEWLGQESARAKIDRLETKAQDLDSQRRTTQYYFYAQLLLVALYLGIVYLLLAKAIPADKARSQIAAWITAALACLPAGLFSPMLEIGAAERNLNFGDIPINARVLGMNVEVQVSQQFYGDMFFYYQSKSVVELIQLLFTQSNYVVGIAILLFSVLFPFGKILATYLLLFRPKMMQNKLLSFFVEKSGKWSMADVFVVAVFLAYLAFSNMQVGIGTQSNVLTGLYFFLAYCVLSLVASSLLASAKKTMITVSS